MSVSRKLFSIYCRPYLFGLLFFSYLIFFIAGAYVESLVAAKKYNALESSIQTKIIAVYKAKEIADSRTVLQREKQVQELVETNKLLSEKLKDAYAKDPTNHSWATTCVPDDIDCLLK